MDVAVVGGGVSGLATAWWLLDQGLTVELWEGDARPGGKIQTDRAHGYVTERAASLVMNYRSEL